jgi:hypothetical protein
VLISSSTTCPVLPCAVFLFSAKVLCAFHISPFRATFPDHLIYLITRIMSGEEYTLGRFSACSFLYVSGSSSLLSHSVLLLSTLSCQGKRPRFTPMRNRE